MNSLFKSLPLWMVTASALGQSPITLSNSNMPSSGDTLRYSAAALNSVGNYTLTGTNFTWNFSSLTPTAQGVRSFKSSLLTPYAFFFFGFNEYGEKVADTLGAGPLTITNYYSFYKKQSTPLNAYIADGVGMSFSAVPVPSYYSDKDELYLFPMSYPKYDSTTFKFSTTASSLIPIQYSKTGYRVTKCDGWGTITTPYGTSACLRLITTQYSQDSIKNNLFPFPFGFSNNQRSYQWLTASTKIPYLEVTGNVVGNNFTITQIRYRDIPRLILGMKDEAWKEELAYYPNPVQNEMILRNESISIQRILVYSLTGQLMKNIQPNVSSGKILKADVSDLNPGIYSVQLNTSAGITSFKIIKE